MTRVPAAHERSVEQRIAATLDAPNPATFFEELGWIEAPTRKIATAELPELLRMVRVLWSLWLQMDLNGAAGIGRFVLTWPSDPTKDVAPWAHEAEAVCRSIGATLLADALAASFTLFPDDRVPAEYAMRAGSAERVRQSLGETLAEVDFDPRAAILQFGTRYQAFLRTWGAELTAMLTAAKARGTELGSLDHAFSIDEPLAFVDAIQAATRPAWRHGDPSENPVRPEPLQMMVVLRWLVLDVSGDGMWRFLDSHDAGRYVAYAEGWCRTIGASRAASYLAATAALFPAGVVPVDDDERSAVVEVWSSQRPDPLVAVDREYSGAIDEVLPRVRDYLRANRGAVESLFAAAKAASPITATTSARSTKSKPAKSKPAKSKPAKHPDERA